MRVWTALFKNTVFLFRRFYSLDSSPLHFRILNQGTFGKINSRMAVIIKIREMGRVKKIEKSPRESKRDWRRLFSTRGLKIMAMIMGAAS